MNTFFKIGDLCLRLEKSRKPFNPALDEAFRLFTYPYSIVSHLHNDQENCSSEMVLREQDELFVQEPIDFLVSNDTWDLWQEENSDFVFRFKRYRKPYLLTIVDQNFKKALFYWLDSAIKTEEISIKDILDIRLYLNWLANFGDLVLHASGFVYDGKAYCFLGESGRGKSTLIKSLVGQEGLTVLGEDQVILRYLDGQFRVFGTPWHLNATLCAALDAPLEKMYFLDRGQTETFSEMDPMTISTRLLQTAFVPWYRRECLPLILERVSILPGHVRCLTLAYKLGRDGLETILSA